MSEQDQYSITPSRNTEEILDNYNSDAKKMRAKAARVRIAARQKAERDAAQRAAIEQIPLEHRYVPDQAS
ncbi:hypothetical protein HRE53_31495 (plasmid) [Acaryochloris sp. 'Moss Beach']|uniref:hypothetical protein n=1 Tax=Acaryochloris sp. 'Moss Beach' TaxID=2740837 RepID=UPI001F3F0851|nr:hypothetical protein [Acaryochloris sp. 'Moss Beach']UJB73229.1 hypothetical protein HRE53_31495 [Acaryochloris sp. 'Moss Beach']